jgi:hypothetical protein
MQADIHSNKIDEIEEIKSLLGLDGYEKELDQVVSNSSNIIGRNIMISVYGLIQKITKDKYKSEYEKISSTNNLKDFQKKENLFNNFDEFVKNCNLNDLGFDINEKSPSNFSNVIIRNFDDKEKPELINSQITYSPGYFKVIKETFEINIESKHKPITYSLPREQREARDTSNNYSSLNKNNKKINKENNKNASSNMTDDQIFSESLKSLKPVNSNEKSDLKDGNNQKRNKSFKDKNWKGSNYNNQKNNNNLEKRNSGQNYNEKYQEETYTEEYYNDNTTSNYSNYEGNYNKTNKNGNGGGYFTGGAKKKNNNYKY